MIDIPASLEIISNSFADVTTNWNPAIRQMLDVNRTEMEAINAEEFRNNLWTLALILFGITVICFLARIARQTKKESSPGRQAYDGKPADQKPPIVRCGPSRPTTAKPPLSDSPDRTVPDKLSETVQADQPDSLFSHPDFPYLPKS